jgi:hypothetical protein
MLATCSRFSQAASPLSRPNPRLFLWAVGGRCVVVAGPSQAGGYVDAHGGEKSASHHNEGKSHKQQLERERKGKQRQRKRATARASLEEALIRVETARASLDNLNALDAAIVSAKRILEHGGASCSTDALVVHRLQVVTCLSC